jgi:uncharacterized protein (DUF2132 family)
LSSQLGDGGAASIGNRGGKNRPADDIFRRVRGLAAREAGMSDIQKKNPLHGVTLEIMLNRLVDFYGWKKLGKHINIKCFNNDPDIQSSLKFLRKTAWAREKVESFYLHYGDPPWRRNEAGK